MTPPDALPREERRRRTEAAILHAAQEQFGDVGFERTTIRSVAAAASVDPALVMQHFGSKQGLFAAVGRALDGGARTCDLGGTLTTRAMGDAVLAALREG